MHFPVGRLRLLLMRELVFIIIHLQ